MLINEVSKASGFSKDTIRYYEKVGLMGTVEGTRGANNYRQFGERELDRLRKIRILKDLGFTLKEIRELFDLESSGMLDCGEAARIADKRIGMIVDTIAKLTAMNSRLKSARRCCAGDCRKVLSDL